MTGGVALRTAGGAPARRGRGRHERAPIWRRAAPDIRLGRRVEVGGGYVVGLLTALLAVRSWFSPGRFVAAGDIGPFERAGLRQDLGTAWGYGITGAGSVTAEAARLPEYLVHQVVTGAGGSAVLAQQIFYVAVLWFASAGVVFAARRCEAAPPAQLLVAVLAIANPLLAVNLPNPLVPAALGTLGFLLGCLLDVVRGRGSAAVNVVTTLPMAYLSINPPTLAVVAAAAGAGAVVAGLARSDARRGLWRAGRAAAPLFVVVHAWWVVPTVVLHSQGSGAEMSAVTDPAAWSWTHVNNSLGNVVTLTAHWGWGLHEYLPFSRELDASPLSGARWALPVLALLAPIAAASTRTRRIGLVALAIVGCLVVIGKGLHGPGAGFNRALYEMPGMWLLREPMSKIGPVLLLAYLVAVAVTVDGVVRRTSTRRRGATLLAVAARSGTLVLIAAALAFGHPVLTGGVAPVDRSPLPSSRVELPEEWRTLAAAIDADTTTGKVLVLPRLPFYQATTTWGFHGVATLPRDLFQRPVLLDLPGGYFGEHPTVKDLVTTIEHGRSPALLERALDALDVSHVVIRRDLSDAQAVKPVAATDALLRRLRSSGVFEPAVDHGVAVLLSVADARTGPSIHRPVAADHAEGAHVLAVDRSVATVEAADASAKMGGTVLLDGGAAVSRGAAQLHEAGRYRVEALATIARSFRAEPRRGSVRLLDGLRIRLGDSEMAAGGELVLVGAGDAVPSALSVDGQPVAVAPGDHVDVGTGTVVAALSEVGGARPLAEWSSVGDCARSNDRRPSIRSVVSPDGVRLTASAHAACVEAPPAIAGRATVRGSVEVRRGSGRICVWSDRAGRCTWERRFGVGQTDLVAAIDVPADARVFLYADAADEPAEVIYRETRMTRLRGGPSKAVPALIRRGVMELDQGKRDVVLTGRADTHRLGEPSSVGDCHQRDGRARLHGEWDGRRIRLRAEGGSACVYFPVDGIRPNVPYTIDFEYRTSDGMARFCLWLERAARCANDDQALAASDSWQTHRSTVIVDDRDVDDVRLYLYADPRDGPTPRPAENDYRDIGIVANTPVIVGIIPSEDESPARLIRSSGGGDRWRFAVSSDGEPFVLSLPDSRHSGWRLRGLPSGTRVEAVTVDGFRQGWLIEGSPLRAASLSAVFVPSQWTRTASWSSAGALLLLLAIAIHRRVGSWRDR